MNPVCRAARPERRRRPRICGDEPDATGAEVARNRCCPACAAMDQTGATGEQTTWLSLLKMPDLTGHKGTDQCQ